MKTHCLKFCILIGSLLYQTAYTQQSTVDLNISVHSFKELKGTLRVCLIDNKDDFLKNCIQSKNIPVTQKEIKLAFTSIPQGNYAVSLYHDLNNNDELETKGFFGMPSEPFGFSNNPSTLFGPPKFKEASFLLNQDQHINIKLK